MTATPALDLIAAYAALLRDGYSATNDTQERAEYERRLSASAQMLEAVRRSDGVRFRSLLTEEALSHGWGFLAGPGGVSIRAAFQAMVVQARIESRKAAT